MNYELNWTIRNFRQKKVNCINLRE
uniref:Uncharacterized protein n=1 Tax=Arundo donax TaxID=35708 RepID=A0A0A8Z5B0_ARUDO